MEKTKITYYSAGAATISEETNLCYAKKFENSQMTTYYVKSNARNFFDPSSDKHSIEWNFTKVKQEAFDNYLEFLKTGTKRYLDTAERVF
mgnify:CR=1 FL=1